MNIRFFAQRNVAALAIIGTILLPAFPSSAADDAMFFTGGGYGPSPEVAIQAAIWDAETSASAYQLFTCELAGEPEVFPQNSPIRGDYFGAQVTLGCTP